jgi:hypothetical protein
MKKMTSIVQECLEQHEGGEVFFDNLDEMIRNDEMLINMMISEVLKVSFDFIVVSGSFGKVFHKHCCKHTTKKFVEKIVCVPGGLRNGTPVGILPSWIKGKTGIFIDDSFYLGRTRNAIIDTVKTLNAQINNTFVFYDGSKEKDNSVHSFYRYYDVN